MSDLAAQILGMRFAALVREGAEGFAAMSRSPLVIDEGQYACAILDGAGQVVAQDQGEPSQLAAVQATVVHMLDAFAFDLAEGDVLLAGDPYAGGTWAGVLTLVVPVFSDGDIRFIAAIRFALPDLAGNIPGPYQPDAHEIWQEALRVTPVKLFRAGAPQKDLRQYLLRNSRASEILDSDLTTAMVMAQRVGRQISAMIAAKGLALIEEAANLRISYGAARAAAHLEGLQTGEVGCEGILAAIRPGAPLTVDLTCSSISAENAENMTLTTTRSVVLVQLLSEVIEDAGLSQGILDAVTVIAPEGSVVNAKFPAAVSLGWRVVAPRLAHALADITAQPCAIAPAPPLAMLFHEIGAGDVAQPMVLSPGFVPHAGCAGSDAASGRRRIISAEEAETAGHFVLERRERTEQGMTASLRLSRTGFEAVLVPGASLPQLQGGQVRPRSNVLSVEEGARLNFDYLAVDGGSDAK